MAQLNLPAFLADVGKELLQALLEKRGVSLPERLPSDEKPRVFGRKAEELIGRAGEYASGLIEADLDRCQVMSDEAGELSLYDVADAHAEIRAGLEAMNSLRSRALYMLIHYEHMFREAEHRRHRRHYYRSKRYWSRYQVNLGGDEMFPDADQIEASGALCGALQRAHPEKHPIEIEAAQAVTQPKELLVAVNVAQAARGITAWEKNEFVTRPIREASTATVLFDAATGYIDIAGKFWRSMGRDRMAQAFVEHGLGLDTKIHRVRPAGFDLSSLVALDALDVDPDDGIESVQVVQARFQCAASPGITHTWRTKGHRSLWSAMEAELGAETARAIRSRGPEFMALAVKVPKSSDVGFSSFEVSLHADGTTSLKETTRAQELLIRKYLPRWGVLDELDAPVIDEDVID